MSLQSIIVVNTAPGCNNFIEQQVSATTCNTYIVRITQNTNALGPFNVYIDTTGSTPVYSAQTRTEMLNGVPVQLGPCVTPTPTPTPTITPSSVTPTPTPTPSFTPSETPTNTPTPTTTETPTQTPTTTETPTQTPTQTSTGGITPTPTTTETPTPTQTPTNTETNTPTPTNTETPTQTPTETPTPTPSPTQTIFDILLLDQQGNQLIFQNGDNWLIQSYVPGYSVSSGDSICVAGSYVLSQTIYSPSASWGNALRFFSDINLTTPFNGGNLWYANDIGGCSMWQIGNDGFVIGTICTSC